MCACNGAIEITSCFVISLMYVISLISLILVNLSEEMWLFRNEEDEYVEDQCLQFLPCSGLFVL